MDFSQTYYDDHGSDQGVSQLQTSIATSATIGSTTNSVRLNSGMTSGGSIVGSVCSENNNCDDPAGVSSDVGSLWAPPPSEPFREAPVGSAPCHTLCGATLGNKRTQRRRNAAATARLPQSDPSDILVLLGDWQDAAVPLKNMEVIPPRPGYKMVEAVFDTGAWTSCTPPDLFPGPVRASKMSKAGKGFAGPDQSPIPNLGEQECSFLVEDGTPGKMCLQVAPIDKILIAGAQMTYTGKHKVELEKESGAIIDVESGRQIPLHRRGNEDGGVFIMRLWIPDNSAAGFTRQVAPKR